MWTSFALAIGEVTFGPGSATTQGNSAASTGEPRPGSLRFAHAGVSSLTGGFNDGYLLLRNTNPSLWHIGSSFTGCVGHSGMWDQNGGIGNAPFTSKWVIDILSATTRLSANKQFVHTHPHSGYSGIPFVYIGSGATIALVGLDGLPGSATSFGSFWSFIGDSAASRQNNVPFVVISIGTVAVA